MIPTDIRLYTWIDVEEVLLRTQSNGQWDNGILWARAYWDGLELGIHPECDQENLRDWLNATFEPRYRTVSASEGCGFIVLESLEGETRELEVFLEIATDHPQSPKYRPTWSRPNVLMQLTEEGDFPPLLSQDLPPVIAFHSFKGGVGRTTHALALARAYSAKKQKILLVDADLEAPGISWLLEQEFPNPLVSFADLLALAHSDSSPDGSNAISLVVDNLRGMILDDIYVLPAFRSTHQLHSLEIKPEHLIQGMAEPFILTKILAELGKGLEVSAVIVDLRAGLSELAAGLLLDPRVYRVFVTTSSGQSVSGTVQVLKILAERAISNRKEDPFPAVIISQVPDDNLHTSLVEDADYQMLQALEKCLVSPDDSAFSQQPLRITTKFFSGLQVLPLKWSEVMNRLDSSGLVIAVGRLMEWLPTLPGYLDDSQPIDDLNDKRRKLHDFARKRIFAETSADPEFLPISPLRRLASEHTTRLPVVVIVGSKGAGKTYTFLQLVYRKQWADFVRDTQSMDGISALDAYVCPILSSRNLTDGETSRVNQARVDVAEHFSSSQPLGLDKIRDHIRASLNNSLHEGQWREIWLDIIAWNLGFSTSVSGAGRQFIESLSTSGKKLVAVLDGLEDLFQDFSNSESQQIALRALIQEVPDWLAQQPKRPLGLIVFIRRDMVISAIRQNANQMMARYEPYALKWNTEEALRLVTWISRKAQALPETGDESLQDRSEEELISLLVGLWGQKLGTDKSNEARSAQFVIAALSDFKGQIQARDLLRLLTSSARKSIDDTRWSERVLTPSAIRGSLTDCSVGKIEDIQLENNALKNIFTNLNELPEEKKKIPFTRESLDLSTDQLKTLEDNGVILRHQDEYYMPEIFRLGLKFSLKGGARPKVLALARRVQQGN